MTGLLSVRMQLNGVITPDRPLLVLAAEEEAAYLDGSLPVLVTGIGKVNAAAALAIVLTVLLRETGPRVRAPLGQMEPVQ